MKSEGTGGKSIKELKSVTNARIIVSGALEVFPGTGERVVLISGNINAVDLAQTLVWEMIAQNVQSGSDRSVDWSPEVVVNNLSTNDTVEVKAKITIPAAVGGLILGRGGETIKEIAADSGASIIMTRLVIFVTLYTYPALTAKCLSIYDHYLFLQQGGGALYTGACADNFRSDVPMYQMRESRALQAGGTGRGGAFLKPRDYILGAHRPQRSRRLRTLRRRTAR